MYVFFTDRPPLPVINFYKSRFWNLEPIPNPDADKFSVATYIWNTYGIPYTFCQVFLRKYVQHYNTNLIGEMSFINLLIRLNSANISDIPSRVELFQIIDANNNCFVTTNDFNTAIEESNISFDLKMKMMYIMTSRNFNQYTALDFLDFLQFMDEVDKVE